MRNTSLLALGFASAVALAAATPSFAITTHHATHYKVNESTSAYAQQQRADAYAQDQQAKQCWIRGEMGENPNGGFGYWGSCSLHGALPGR
jgi:hypothetical protein